jgi:hypothetical protein
MKSVIALAILLTAGLGHSQTSTNCHAEEPCLHEGVLGYCLSTIHIDHENRVSTISIRNVKDLPEVLATIPVQIWIGRGSQNSGFIGSSEDGEIRLFAAGRSPALNIGEYEFSLGCEKLTKSNRRF